MDEFIKATPSIKKLVEYLKDLKPFESVEFKVPEDGGIPDTLIITRKTKVMIKQGSLKYIK